MYIHRSPRRAIAAAAALSLAAVGAGAAPAGAQPKDTRSAMCLYWDSLDDTMGYTPLWRTTLQGDPTFGSIKPGETITVSAGPGVYFLVEVYAADGTVLDHAYFNTGGVYSRTVTASDAEIYVGRPHAVTWTTTCTAAKPGNGPKEGHSDKGNHGQANNGHHGRHGHR